MTEQREVIDAVDDPQPRKVAGKVPMTTEQLAGMLLETQRQLADSQRQLADAILESRKPYVDPAVLEAKRRANEERRLMIEAEMREREARKRVCPHVRENGTSNIKWMEHSGGIVLGVCGQCFSQFDARVPADMEFFRKDLKSQRNMGRAGQHARRGVLAGI